MLVLTSRQPVALTQMVGSSVAISAYFATRGAPQPAHRRCPGASTGFSSRAISRHLIGFSFGSVILYTSIRTLLL